MPFGNICRGEIDVVHVASLYSTQRSFSCRAHQRVAQFENLKSAATGGNRRPVIIARCATRRIVEQDKA